MGIGATSGRRLRRQLTEANSVHADYTIALPKASATTVKAAAATELATIPAVTIPAAATVSNSAITVATADIVAPAPKSYAWVAVDATCPSACGQSASTPAKTVTCKEDGATTVADSECTAKVVPRQRRRRRARQRWCAFRRNPPLFRSKLGQCKRHRQLLCCSWERCSLCDRHPQ